MFRRLRELFGSEDLLQAAFATTLTMLEMDLRMFEASSAALRRSDSAELPFDVRQEDRRINKYEREVRRNVLTHLSVAGTQNIVPGLVLVSIVIDVERIGDYTKNIAELAQLHPGRLEGGPYEGEVAEIESQVNRIFPLVLRVLREQEAELARNIMAREDRTGKMAEAIVQSLISEKGRGLPVAEAVSLALYARYLKRINAHLTNIASAVGNPFPRLGFRAKPDQGD
ncbi:MAG TPA: PhoU domain-containing protein [candidate division Zixibacteria bacterium]|nr:PhoU domain-containing protein [candidate division Zixibacteria bacterium]HQL23386.1 PhoU domain-containing protein [candidate division Zixibacteria bacterium]